MEQYIQPYPDVDVIINALVDEARMEGELIQRFKGNVSQKKIRQRALLVAARKLERGMDADVLLNQCYEQALEKDELWMVVNCIIDPLLENKV